MHERRRRQGHRPARLRTRPAASRRPPPSRASTRSTRTTKKPLDERAAFDTRDAGAAARRRGEPRNAEVLEVPAGVLVLRAERRPTARATRRARPLVGHPGQPGALGHRHQEPGAELRHERRQRADRDLQLHEQGPQGVPGDHAPGRPARRRQRARPGPVCRPRSTSRSCSTTSSSRRRTSTTARTRTASTARPARRSPAASRSSPRRTWRRSSRSARCRSSSPISRSQVSATLGKQALDQGLTAGIAGFIDRRALPDHLLPRPGPDRGARPVHLRALLLRAGQADPDHADAAGHRGPDPHARRRGGREHRHLRTRQGRGAGRADRSARRSSRATARA